MQQPSKEFNDYYTILSTNSLFGYQYGIGIEKGQFKICWCDENINNITINQLKEISGANTIVHDDYIGHGYLLIHWTEVRKIADVFNTMLMLGLWFKTGNCAQVTFDPRKGDEYFSDELMERKMVGALQDESYGGINSDLQLTWKHYKIWNYFTEEGRQYCDRLRTLKGKKPYNFNSNGNYWLWSQVRQFRFMLQDQNVNKNENRTEVATEVATKVEFGVLDGEKELKHPGEVKKDEEEYDEECMICLSARPNTKVFPCGDCVVCVSCSEALKSTNDAKVCVKCRRPITGEPIILN